jgi:glycosyltransferase involved in cell wall biosynthesis
MRLMPNWTTVHITTLDLTAYCFLRSWFTRLRAEGHRVILLTTVERFAEPLSQVAEVIHVPIPRRIDPRADVRALVQLHAKLVELKPDFVHTHTSKAGLLGRLAARWAGVPRIIHTIHELPQNAADNSWVKSLYRWIEIGAARLTDHFVTVSSINHQQILAEGICPPEKLTTVSNGLDLSNYAVRISREEQRAAWGLPHRAFVLGTSARLERAKGHTYLLQALPELLRRIPELYWVSTSSTGLLRDELTKHAERLGISERVRWLGWVEDLPSALAALDLFVLPTLYEGQGVVLLEAMAVERAVVCSRVGGTQDVLVDGETGIFVPPRQPAALVEAIDSLYRDPGRAEAMGKAGRRRVEQCFRSQISDDRLLEVYTRLWNLRPGSPP